MENRYICYCGLYCENCAVMAKIDPAAEILYNEMKKAGFEDVIHFIPGGDGFWPFLKNMAENGSCASCRSGGGDPGCAIRLCAMEKGVEMCAFCESYPCETMEGFLRTRPAIRADNALLLEKGLEAWSELQDGRRASGYVFQDQK